MKILKSIFLFCILHFAFCVNSNAQIVYTDVMPDDTVGVGAFIYNNDTLALDLNNDLVNDFHLITHDQHGGCGSGWHATQTANARVKTDTNTLVAVSGSFPMSLNYGQLIDSNLIWANSSFPFILRSYSATGNPCAGNGTYSGNWSDSIGGHFLPVEIIQSGNNYYGWIKLRVLKVVGNYDIHYSIIVQDYAYNSVPNTHILAGDTGNIATAIIHQINGIQLFTIYPNPLSSSTTISFTISTVQNVSINIFDLNGRLIQTLADNIFKEGKHQIEFNAEKFNAGIYFLKIQAGDFIETKKLTVVK